MADRGMGSLGRIDRELRRSSGVAADALAMEALHLAARWLPDRPAGRATDLVTWFERWVGSSRRRRGEAALSVAARAFPRLTEPGRERVLAALGLRTLATVRRFAESPEEAPRLASAALAGASGELEALPTVAGLIDDPREAVSSAAGEALVALARRWPESNAGLPGGSAERIVAAVGRAAESYPTHRRLDAVVAALLVLTPEVRAGRCGRLGQVWLAELDDAARLAVRAAIKRLPGPAGAQRAFELLPRSDLARAAAERCIAALLEAPEALAAVSHLTRRRVRAAAWRERVERDRLRAVDPGVWRSEEWPIESRRGLASLVDLLRLPEPARSAALEPLLADDEPVSRLSLAIGARGELLADAALDGHAGLAMLALTRLRFDPSAGGGAERVAPLLARSPHAAVRRFSQRWLGATGERTGSMRASLARDPAGTIDRLRNAIRRGEVHAALIARRLEVVDQLLPDLLEGARSADARFASACAAAVGASDRDEAGQALESLLLSPDPRVVSNAIEGLSHRARRGRGRLDGLDRVEAEHHRPVTTALLAQLRGGLDAPQAGASVLGLLADAARDRRMAALWLVERGARELKPAAGRGWADIAAVVAGLARSGETAPERARATRCARRMLAEVRPGG
ncbi:MAG: hypothetical protein ACTS22_01290 [Phycisphaerales bacterium]